MIKQIGIHRVQNKDVTALNAIATLMQEEKACMMYSDPPWGEGNIKYWATMNKKMTGNENIPATLENFLQAVFDAGRDHVTDYMLIEYGIRWREQIIQKGKEAGYAHLAVINIQYRGGKNGGLLPLDLHVFAKNGNNLPDNYIESVLDSSGFDCVMKAFEPIAKQMKAKYGNPIVLDPCCGMGYTAQASINTGMAFRGNELNSKRLDKTIARLNKA